MIRVDLLYVSVIVVGEESAWSVQWSHIHAASLAGA